MSAVSKPIHESDPRPGYYKLRWNAGGKWQPVAIWRKEDGELVARVGPDMKKPGDIWTWCAGNPVAKADARHAFEHGVWPNDAPAPIGDNAPPSDDPFENLQREIEAEELRVKAWVAEPHEGPSKAELASNWLTSLRRLEGKTIDAFDAEKAPALAETKRIDSKWRNLKARAKEIKDLMDGCYQAIGRKEKARLQAIADKKAAEEAAAKRKEWEAEQARKQELAAQHNIPLEPEAPPQLELMPAAPVKVAFGGAQGAKIAVRAIPPKAVVEDWAKAAAFYSTSDKVREVVMKLINHDIRDGRSDGIPGVKVIPGEA